MEERENGCFRKFNFGFRNIAWLFIISMLDIDNKSKVNAGPFFV